MSARRRAAKLLRADVLPAVPSRGDVPSFARRPPLALHEVEVPAAQAATFLVPGVNDYLRAYTLGECSVLVTREHGDWHLSIAHPGRYPTWDEIAEARYRILPDGVTMALLLPPKSKYVNINENCFQLVQLAVRVAADY